MTKTTSKVAIMMAAIVATPLERTTRNNSFTAMHASVSTPTEKKARVNVGCQSTRLAMKELCPHISLHVDSHIPFLVQGDDHCDDGNNKESCDWDGAFICLPARVAATSLYVVVFFNAIFFCVRSHGRWRLLWPYCKYKVLHGLSVH